MSVAGRTYIDFQSDQDVWGTLDRWAAENKYSLKQQDASGRLYQKGENLMVPPMMLWAGWNGASYHLEAWVRFPAINRILSLGMLPEEARLESDSGKLGFVPRNKLRKELNLLLGQLGLPPIN
jgi:hypothetical protein